MERAKEIYLRVQQKGYEALIEFIDNRESENLFLDFKRATTTSEKKGLESSDRNNLEKAISGFGNSEGGVVIWGIDCSSSGGRDDCAQGCVPIKNPSKFKSLIEQRISGCTIPVHNEIDNYVIDDPDRVGFGYIATYIPKSNYAPHQTITDKKYYIRVGSSFEPTPHAVLAGMFGRRPQPHIIHRFLIEPATLNFNEDTKTNNVRVSFSIKLVNLGPGIATDVFMNLMSYQLPGENCKKRLDFSGSQWHINSLLGVQCTSVFKPEYRLVPEGWVSPGCINIWFEPPFNGELLLKFTYGSGQTAPCSFEIKTPKEVIQAAYDKLLMASRDNRVTKEAAFQFLYAVIYIVDEDIDNIEI